MEHCVFCRVINVPKSVGLIHVKIPLDVLNSIVSIKQTSVQRTELLEFTAEDRRPKY
jgi:hypothetical protein